MYRARMMISRKKCPLTVYAVCWQDTSEPWGWAPDGGLFFSRQDADDELRKQIGLSIGSYLSRSYAPVSREKAEEWARGEWSIQEYKVK